MFKSIAQSNFKAMAPSFMQLRLFTVSATSLSLRQARRHETVYKTIEKHAATLQGLDAAAAKKHKKKAHTAISNLHTRELKNLQQLKDKFKKEQQAYDAKAKDAYKKLVREASKPLRKMPAIAAFVKENSGAGASLKELSQRWAVLTEEEKQPYQDIANNIYQEKLKIYTPEPKSPPNAYAAYMKENYPEGESFADASKQIATQWKAMSEDAKAQYKPSAAELEKYATEHKKWLDNRIQLYLDSKAKK